MLPTSKSRTSTPTPRTMRDNRPIESGDDEDALGFVGFVCLAAVLFIFAYMLVDIGFYYWLIHHGR